MISNLSSGYGGGGWRKRSDILSGLRVLQFEVFEVEGRLRLVSEGGFVVAFNGCEQLAVFVFQAFDDFGWASTLIFGRVCVDQALRSGAADFDAHAGCGFDQAAAVQYGQLSNMVLSTLSFSRWRVISSRPEGEIG